MEYVFQSNSWSTYSIVGIYLEILGTYKYGYQEMPQVISGIMGTYPDGWGSLVPL